MISIRHFSCLVLVGTFLSSSIAQADPADPFEVKLRSELERLTPSALPSWDAANRARDENKPKEAENGYRDVIRQSPNFDHAHRRLCSELLAQDQRDSALPECRRALALSLSAENEAALANALVATKTPSDAALREAGELIESAEGTKPGDPIIVGLGANVSLARSDLPAFTRDVEKLQRMAPLDRSTAYFGILLDLNNQDIDAARTKLQVANENHLFDADSTQKLERLIDDVDSQPTPGRQIKRFGKVVLLWAATFAFLFLFGALLSRLTLRATQVATRETNGAAVGGTAWIRRLYAGLIAFASLYFYLSLPLVALLVLGIGGGIIYGIVAAGFISPKLFIIIILIVCASLWAMAKSVIAVFRKSKDHDPGISIEAGAHPKLDQVIASVSKKVGTRTVDRIFISPGTTMAVFERGSAFKTMRGHGERCLIVGAGLLSGFKVGPFKAVLAHEFGHFKNEDTAGGSLSLAVRRSMGEMVMSLARGGAASRINPAWLFVEGFYKVFLRISHGASRLQEVLADRWAVYAYGSEAFVSGLRHVIESDARFDHTVSNAVRFAAAEKKPLANLYAGTGITIDDDKVREVATAALDRKAGPYDSHPTPSDRLESALLMNVSVETEAGDDDEVWSLLAERTVLEKSLMGEVCKNLEENTGLVLSFSE